jgi:hypothetical protein
MMTLKKGQAGTVAYRAYCKDKHKRLNLLVQYADLLQPHI